MMSSTRSVSRAVRAAFDATETDMRRLELDNSGVLFLYSPEVWLQRVQHLTSRRRLWLQCPEVPTS